MQELKEFTPEEHQTWKKMFSDHAMNREQKITPLFREGIEALGLTSDRIPKLSEVNARLKERTGFQAVPVTGLEGPDTFYELLSERKFPVGNFIRDARDLSYTPAPDVFHDLYGHVPFFVDPEYADFCQRFGQTAIQQKHNSEKMREFERLFWFSIEFGLVQNPDGDLIIFGAGIASSLGECDYALGPVPEKIPFIADKVRQQEFRIDQMQERLFILKSPKALYQLVL